jgi:FdhE protein
MVRVKCSSCEADKGIEYLALDSGGATAPDGTPASQPVRAEACNECKTYLKIMAQEKDPLVDPAADDLATLALDVLVDEQGFARSGPNLLFHPGGA